MKYASHFIGQAQATFLGSNSLQLVVAKRKSRPAGLRYNSHFSYNPIPSQLAAGRLYYRTIGFIP
ncbi:MAG: hypothetical protein PVJ56_15895, partial [Desulfobacterales bacterium]